jgi:diadenosine tetraphosphate (Ap4A) HIT family hydrolase
VFSLHKTLQDGTVLIGDLPLCRVLLMNNRNFPWLILVPRREGLRELFDLIPADYSTLMQELRDTAAAFSRQTKAHKMNVAALGNMVPQLHIHVIARFPQDSAWPNPVWGQGNPAPYLQDKLMEFAEITQKNLNITKM